MKTYIVKDTMEAFLESTNGETYFLGLLTEASVTRNISQESIKAGINSKVIGVVQNDDGMEVSVTTGIYYKNFMEIPTGSKFANSAALAVQDVTVDAEGLVTATEKTVTGDFLELTAGAFAKNCKLQLKTIAYDPDTNEVVADIYWIFPKATPSSNFEQAFGMGVNNVQTIGFTPQVDKATDSYGQYIIAPRVIGE